MIFLLGLTIVNAEENYTQSITINHNETSSNLDRVIYNDPNHTNKAFANHGRGYLITTLLMYKTSGTNQTAVPTIYSVNARTDQGYSTCEVDSVSNIDNQDNNAIGTLYGIKCDLEMTTNGLISLSVNFYDGSSGQSFNTKVGRLTFNNNLQAQNIQWIEYIYHYLQDWIYPKLNGIALNMQNIDNNTNWIYQYLQNYIYIRLGAIETSINSGNIQNHTDLNAILKEIEEMKKNQSVCEIIDKNKIKDDNVALNENGTTWETNVWGITDYIKISNTANIKQIASYSYNTNAYMCIYNTNKVKISCTNVRVIPTDITIPDNANYIRFSIRKDSNLPQFEICKNGNQAMVDNQQEIIDSDIDEEDKEQVDKTEYNNYKSKEDNLMNTANQADLSNLNIGIDTNASSSIWQIITRIIQSNAKIFTLFISILSIGIIKIALAR